jgi:hypothetical protein
MWWWIDHPDANAAAGAKTRASIAAYIRTVWPDWNLAMERGRSMANAAGARRGLCKVLLPSADTAQLDRFAALCWKMDWWPVSVSSFGQGPLLIARVNSHEVWRHISDSLSITQAFALSPVQMAFRTSCADWTDQLTAAMAALPEEVTARVLSVSAHQSEEPVWSLRDARKRLRTARLDARLVGVPTTWRAPDFAALGQALQADSVVVGPFTLERPCRQDGTHLEMIRATVQLAVDLHTLQDLGTFLVTDLQGLEHELAFQGLSQRFQWQLPADTGWVRVWPV